jgi:hypothetical protein
MSRLSPIISTSILLAIQILYSFSFVVHSKHALSSRYPFYLSETVNQSKDALRILVDFHEGLWKGKATSFSITNDLSSGIRMKKVSNEYTTSIKVGLDLSKKDYTMTEIFAFSDQSRRREISLLDANTDVDVVDGSYSLDVSLPDLPEEIIGTPRLLQFGIEHCVAINDNARIRALAFYGIDQSLARIVICHEERIMVQKGFSIDATRADDPPGLVLTPVPIEFLELTAGVWLGDVVLREPSYLTDEKAKGFAPATKNPRLQSKKFANWAIGVQKVAHQWKWNFEDSVQKLITVGKPLGINMCPEMSTSISGIVYQNEINTANIPREQRVIYFDWMGGELVGFIINNVSFQV